MSVHQIDHVVGDELTSQGAMAGHAYKAAVDELDTGVGRELVCSRSL
jgi:hypothetical protein